MTKLNRVLLAAAMSWGYSVTQGLLFAACAPGRFRSARSAPGVVPVALIISTTVAVIITNCMVCENRCENLCIYAPILWIALACVVISRTGAHGPYGLFLLGLVRRLGAAVAEKTVDTIVITGAFSYTGKYATRLLLGRGYRVRTLTYHPERANPFGDRVHVFHCNFDDPVQLSQTLRGASTLVNTYWVRFPRGKSTFKTAVYNTRTLIWATREAGVKRIVHVSIANPSLQSPLGYYKGKTQLENKP